MVIYEIGILSREENMGLTKEGNQVQTLEYVLVGYFSCWLRMEKRKEDLRSILIGSSILEACFV
jgi:hypothetical protein